jgi:hypothetical protein
LQGRFVNYYQEKLAPIFLQIILQKEYEQHQVLRECYERFLTQPYATGKLKKDYLRFESAAGELKELWSAQKRIKDKSYGKCNDCGDRIDLRRLNMHPATLHCLNCSYKRDRHALRDARDFA